VDAVDFHQPVEVGEMLSLMATVNYVGTSSMIVGIKVIAEHFQKGTAKHTNTSYFTMVGKDENGAPAKVPGLLLETREDARRFIEAIHRKRLGAQYRSELDNARTQSLEADLSLLVGQRCKLAEGIADV
jgi:acyl-CoA hydrolase